MSTPNPSRVKQFRPPATSRRHDYADNPESVLTDRKLTVREAAKALGCGRTKVTELVYTGQLVGYRVGRNIRVAASSVAAYLERVRVR